MKSLNYLLIGTICFLTLFSCGTSNTTEQNDDNKIEKTSKAKFDYGEKIEKLISKMSIEEKVGQMTQINLDVISKGEVFNLVEPHELDPIKLDSAINHYFVGSFLNVGGHTYTREHWEEIITEIQKKAVNEGNGIPIIYGIDAIHGVNYTVDATLFPQQLGQAATWNPSLVEEAGSVTAYECRASGIPWNFSPVLDLARQPLWSRFFETYGEDVYLAKEMTEAAVKGYQGNDPSNPYKVAACMKHFLGYSMPVSGKDRTPAWIPERQLKEYFLPTFKKAIDNNALTLMINSGEINGIPVHANPKLLTDLLRNELGFKGIAVTDWEDIIKLYRDHKIAKDMREAVKIAVLAGVDMSMTPNNYSFNRALIDLVKSGEVPESRLDEACRRILWVKNELGLLDSPIPNFNQYPDFASEKHHNIARMAAEESITLLKNENELLPLNKNSKVLICGPAANSLNIQNGAWTHTWQGVDDKFNTEGRKTIFEAISASSNGQVKYVEGGGLDSLSNLNAIKSAAQQAEVVVICLGELPSTEKPGDIEDLQLPKAQIELVNSIKSVNKNIVLVNVFNRPLLINQIEGKVGAILHAYQPGDFGGEAIARIIYGEVNPSGKLPFTYPRYSASLVPYDHKHTEKLDKFFGDKAFNPQWEFGFGLSYTNFVYDKLSIDKSSYGVNDTIIVSVNVSNTGQLEGKEVVQVYISDLVASITPSVKRLRAFKKINLKAGETRTVDFKIPVQELSFVGINNQWNIESGDFQLLIQNLSSTFSVQ